MHRTKMPPLVVTILVLFYFQISFLLIILYNTTYVPMPCFRASTLQYYRSVWLDKCSHESTTNPLNLHVNDTKDAPSHLLLPQAYIVSLSMFYSMLPTKISNVELTYFHASYILFQHHDSYNLSYFHTILPHIFIYQFISSIHISADFLTYYISYVFSGATIMKQEICSRVPHL